MATIGAEIPERVAAIFADARTIHGEALERLQAGDIRDAAEKAWCATKRATDALILARTGRRTSDGRADNARNTPPYAEKTKYFARWRHDITPVLTFCMVNVSMMGTVSRRIYWLRI